MTVHSAKLHFPAYTKEEIFDIITNRLRALDTGEHSADSPKEVDVGVDAIISPADVRFLAAEIAALSGDVGKALDVCRRTVESARNDSREKWQLERSGRFGTQKQTEFQAIGVPQVRQILEDVFRQTKAAKKLLSSLHLYQKLIVASLFVLLNTNPVGKEVTLGKLHETFAAVCGRRNVAPLHLPGVADLCSKLDGHGLLSVRTTRGTGENGSLNSGEATMIGFRVEEREVQAFLSSEEAFLLADAYDCIVSSEDDFVYALSDHRCIVQSKM